ERDSGSAPLRKRSATAANGHVVHAHAAAASGGAHGGHAVAAGLDHRAAGGIAADAGHADAIIGHLALAHAHRHVAAADHHAVHHHAATAHAAGHHGAEVLHHRRRHVVITLTGDLHATLALLHLHRATRHHRPLRAGRHRGRAAHGALHHAARAHSRHPHPGPFHHH